MLTSRRNFTAKLIFTAGIAASGAHRRIIAGPLPAFPDKKPESTAPKNDQEAFKISIFSKHLQWLDYKEMASVLAEIGFDGTDLTVRPGGHVLPGRVEEDLPKAAEELARAGKKIYMLTTAIDNADDPITVRILKTASSLGIRHYRMGWGQYDDTRSVEENISSMQLKLAKLALLNEKYSISGEYQNHSGVASKGIYFGGAIWDTAKVLKEINSPWLGSQYDIYHATVEGANTWPVGFKLISPYIRSIDIKDFKWIERDARISSEAVPLGEGMVDFSRFFRLVKEYKLEIPISLHFEYPLGGAENGSPKLTIERNKVISAMKKDLSTLKEYLQDAGLSV
jgi:sugar phosphate isomerase/epimerase